MPLAALPPLPPPPEAFMLDRWPSQVTKGYATLQRIFTNSLNALASMDSARMEVYASVIRNQAVPLLRAFSIAPQDISPRRKSVREWAEAFSELQVDIRQAIGRAESDPENAESNQEYR